ncbi:MAG: sulfotransferase [Bacteroidota bacterium]
MKIFTIILGIRFPVLMKLVLRNGITPFPVYLFRFLMLLQNSVISSILTLAERKNHDRKIRETEIAMPPIFIIGHWRTGSTYLNQLFNLDPRFTTPTMVQTVIPDHFLFSTKYYVPILKRAMPKYRPMDNVVMGPFEPQEEEFALIRMGSESPLEKLIFPSGKRYFLDGYDQYIPQGKKLESWKKNLLTFFKKITLQTGKQIVSKNPYHAMRIPLLAEMFPGARFIHITRDPTIVVPSTIRMWNIVAAENKLKRGWKNPSVAEASSVLSTYLEYVAKESRKLGTHQFSEIRFEDLEKDPPGELRRIYAELDLPFSETLQAEVMRFVADQKNYQKNAYKLSAEERDIIETIVYNAQTI